MHKIKLVLGVALAYLLTFTDASSMSVTTCPPDKVLRMCCEYGVIIVKFATYETADGTACSNIARSPRTPQTTCFQNNTMDAIKSSCQGKKEAEVNMADLPPNTACPNTPIQLETVYTCVRATHKIICDGSTVKIKCGRRQVISVLGAYYGRQDKTTCSKGHPKSELKGFDCSKSVKDIVDKKCDRKHSCSIKACADDFGDPCVGAYKYLELAYECLSTK